MKAILTFAAATLFLGLAFFFPHLVEAKQQQHHILSATVMITITTPNWQEKAVTTGEALPIPNDEYRTVARAEGNVEADGLGTLVANGENILLVTHDHWSHFDDALGTVTFRAADGTWLAEMDLREFKDHVQSRDDGTMILDAPDVLKTAVPIKATAPQTNVLQAGDHGFLARRKGDKIEVSEVNVIARSEYEGRPVVRLQSTDGQAVVGGDSGGGLWINGRFSATMWTTLMMENRETSVQRETDLSVAAVYQGIFE